MDLGAFFDNEFDEQAGVAAATKAGLKVPFERMIAAAVRCIQGGGKILFFGNGGSAADAQHLATELTIRFIKDRPAIAALALTTDSSTLTAAGNDIGFENIFARQIEALAKPGDLAIGISTSGNSENVIRALKQAKAMGVTAAGFGGKGGGPMAEIADPYLVVPSDTTARIQEMHITLGHMLCGALERELGLA